MKNPFYQRETEEEPPCVRYEATLELALTCFPNYVQERFISAQCFDEEWLNKNYRGTETL